MSLLHCRRPPWHNHRQQLYSRGWCIEPYCVLEEVQFSKNNNNNNNYTTFNISKMLKDEEAGDDGKCDPNTPYTLGPKISVISLKVRSEA